MLDRDSQASRRYNGCCIGPYRLAAFLRRLLECIRWIQRSNQRQSRCACWHVECPSASLVRGVRGDYQHSLCQANFFFAPVRRLTRSTLPAAKRSTSEKRLHSEMGADPHSTSAPRSSLLNQRWIDNLSPHSLWHRSAATPAVAQDERKIGDLSSRCEVVFLCSMPFTFLRRMVEPWEPETAGYPHVSCSRLPRLDREKPIGAHGNIQQFAAACL